jgi:hypothetical protein
MAHLATPLVRHSRPWLFALLTAALLAWSAAGADPGPRSVIETGWQTFESCPMGERPCGPICMPESFSCCHKETASICPPGETCCGARCGCGRCERCEQGVCVPKDECVRRNEQHLSGVNSSNAEGLGAGVPAAATPAAIPAAAALIGIAAGTLPIGSDDREPRPISP